MPSGVYQHKPCSEVRKKNISKSLMGKKLSEKHRLSLRLSHLGNTGYKHSEETKRKIGLSESKTKSGLEKTSLHRNRNRTKPVIKNGKEYNPNWQEIRKEIYKRDNWTCQECGCKCLDKRRQIKGKRIQCHHIDYEIKNCNSDNLITLCASCHAKTNFKRENWINYYKNKMENIVLCLTA